MVTTLLPCLVKRGYDKPCGMCQRTKHGYSRVGEKTEEYNIWSLMRDRCNNEKNHAYKNYGGRGVKVCERWNEFTNFLDDMGKRPSRTSIDRIDNNGDYEPGNCRWATRTEQNRNARSCVYVEIDGVTRTVSEWSVVSGINVYTLYARVDAGCSPEKFLGPPQPGKKRKP
jgi:hypothetical protein